MVLLFISLIILVPAAWALSSVEKSQQERVQEITRQLQGHVLLAGEFRQSRKLQGFSREIESAGVFIYWQDHGLYWETRKPFFQASTFLQGGVIDWRQSDDMPSGSLDGSPVLKNISAIIVPIVGGDLEKLGENFNARWIVGPDNWSVTLDPASFIISKAISEIRITGLQFIDHLAITTSGNDVTEINFFNIVTSSSPNLVQCLYFQEAGSDICDAISRAAAITSSN